MAFWECVFRNTGTRCVIDHFFPFSEMCVLYMDYFKTEMQKGILISPILLFDL